MVATRETDSHRLPAGWNGRGAAISSLGEHLHPQQILVGPDYFQEPILRFLIPKGLPRFESFRIRVLFFLGKLDFTPA